MARVPAAGGRVVGWSSASRAVLRPAFFVRQNPGAVGIGDSGRRCAARFVVSLFGKGVSMRSFEAWMAKVDAHLIKKLGLDSRDLCDICYRDLFDSGVSPSAAARMAIRNECGEDF